VFGYSEITRQYFERYGLPIMHTETNMREGPTGQEAVHWLWKEWANVLRIRNVGIPTVGFTWYSITDQIDWDTALRKQNNRVHPVGLYDLDRNIRPVGEAYKQLIANWRDVLPASSMCLVVPIVPPSRADRPYAREQQEEAAHRLRSVSTEPSSSEANA
jgi:beta-glucosidase